jgi:hypothetical protein
MPATQTQFLLIQRWSSMTEGWVYAMGACICCKGIFSFNPHRVPSTSVITGSKEPICFRCITIINENKAKSGMPLWPVHPDAYEPLPESEL